MPKKIRTKIVGVTKKNEDGQSRQELLELSSDGESLILERDYSNEYDDNAIEVLNMEGERLGYLSRNIAEELAPKIDDGYEATCKILEITGGEELEDGSITSYGCNIEITIYEPSERKTTSNVNRSINQSTFRPEQSRDPINKAVSTTKGNKKSTSTNDLAYGCIGLIIIFVIILVFIIF